MFHLDNAPAHKSVFAMAAVRDWGFELVDHPPYILLVWHHFFFALLSKRLLRALHEHSPQWMIFGASEK